MIWRDCAKDKGLGVILGYQPPATETARQWLDKFHDEALMQVRHLQGSFILKDSTAVARLKEPNRQVVWTYVDKVKPAGR